MAAPVLEEGASGGDGDAAALELELAIEDAIHENEDLGDEQKRKDYLGSGDPTDRYLKPIRSDRSDPIQCTDPLIRSDPMDRSDPESTESLKMK